MLRCFLVLHLLFLLSVGASPVLCESPTANWTHYGGTADNRKFSSADQIDSTNFDQLQMVWRWRSPDFELYETEEVKSHPATHKTTPLMIDGTLYTLTPLSVAVAIDAATGEEIWRFDPQQWKNPVISIVRGLSFWTDGEHRRILFGTTSAHLYCLDATTGELDPDFGEAGRVDLTKSLHRSPEDPTVYGVTSPPVICRNAIVIGSYIKDWHHSVPEFTPLGDVRGFDVRTGELLWTFHTIPHPGEFGHETWETEDWDHFGGNNVWTVMSADEELGYVYLPSGSPSNDHYGVGRPGDNLFGNSLICLDARTGRRIWHFQIIHHDLWNYDLPAAPILMDLTVEGKPVKAVIQLTKHGLCFAFDRVTGEPIWPIVEQPVPVSTVLGEQASPTQPFPTKPAPFEPLGLTEDDLIDFTPELRREVLEYVKDFDYGPPFTPPSERPTIFLPSGNGGADWVGAAVNAEKGWLYIPSKTFGNTIQVARIDDPNSFDQYSGRSGPIVRLSQGLPLTRPPYSRINAIDMNNGEHQWMVATGQGPTGHPDLKHLDLPPLGWPIRNFVLATPTLLLVSSEPPTTLIRSNLGYFFDSEAYLTAIDLLDGHTIGKVSLPANATGNPMTYVANGRQHVVVPIGYDHPAELVALALPQTG